MEWKFLEGVPADDVKRLISLSHSREPSRNETVIREGDPADVIYLVERGHFAVRVSQLGGKTATLAILGPGEIFGELALATKEATRSADVVSLERGRLLGIYRRELNDLRSREPSLNDAVIAILAHQVRRLSERVFEASYLDSATKIRRRLVDLCNSYNQDGQGSVTVPIDQRTLGEISGDTRATVNEVLGEDEALGILERGHGRVVVKDLEALKARAGARLALTSAPGT